MIHHQLLRMVSIFLLQRQQSVQYPLQGEAPSAQQGQPARRAVTMLVGVAAQQVDDFLVERVAGKMNALLQPVGSHPVDGEDIHVDAPT